ncbi:hypothetical protein B0T19DRAFT_157533 [Cercophora scortea]|uniref:Secreted protein n=1 Tax=Cercophora scortea TaxID=314031 RepID=A0AAE0ILM8_9PEZI|nr:hypothetical protein B0T19DRAFT_157533 [Cercophora scortea]
MANTLSLPSLVSGLVGWSWCLDQRSGNCHPHLPPLTWRGSDCASIIDWVLIDPKVTIALQLPASYAILASTSRSV